MLSIQSNQNFYGQEKVQKNKKVSFGAVERTLLCIKPDAFERKYATSILTEIFNNSGLSIVRRKFEFQPRALMERHYSEHKGKPFFEKLIDYVTKGNFGVIEVEGENAVARLKQITSEISAKYQKTKEPFQNIVDSSNSIESAKKEIENFFPPSGDERIDRRYRQRAKAVL